MQLRWVAWIRTSKLSRTVTLDAAQANMRSYWTRAHLAEAPVGGYRDAGNGKAGFSACGRKVPKDDPDEIAWWSDSVDEEPVPEVRVCLHCWRKLQSINQYRALLKQAPALLILVLALIVSGCKGLGGGPGSTTPEASRARTAKWVDVGRYGSSGPRFGGPRYPVGKPRGH